jgi:hypothetical protein
MTSIILLLAVAAILIAVVTVHTIRHAEIGYEDETGFHFGRPPARRRRPNFVRSVCVTCRCTPATAMERRLLRAERHPVSRD